MRVRFRLWLACAVPLVLAACQPPPDRCAGGLGAPMIAYDLFFGLTVPNRGPVTDAEWRAFVEDTVAAQLPDGFTVFDARGAWFSARAGRTIHQDSKVLTVAMPETPAAREAIQRVRDAYRQRFQQQVVGMIAHPTCASFQE